MKNCLDIGPSLFGMQKSHIQFSLCEDKEVVFEKFLLTSAISLFKEIPT